jgi:hypothetical protein
MPLNIPIINLRPNTFALHNTTSQSTWFSYIRRTYSRELGGTIIPPTMSEFIRELCRVCRDRGFLFYTEGDSFEPMKHRLSYNRFPDLPIRPRYMSDNAWANKLKIVTWVQTVLAFNAYAKVCSSCSRLMSHGVDFLGSASNTHSFRNCWTPRFHGRCVLHLADAKIEHLIELVKDDRIRDFWQCIFDLYDSQSFNRRLQNPSYNRIVDPDRQRRRQIHTLHEPPLHPLPSPLPRQRTGTVENPNSLAAEEYLNRPDDAEDDAIPDNQQIAAMLTRITNPLPRDLRKIFYDMCVASQMSYHVESTE